MYSHTGTISVSWDVPISIFENMTKYLVVLLRASCNKKSEMCNIANVFRYVPQINMLPLILYLYLYHGAPKKFAWPVTCELYRYNTTIRPFFSSHPKERDRFCCESQHTSPREDSTSKAVYCQFLFRNP